MNAMLHCLRQNSGAILVIVAMLTLGGVGISWVISEITDVRGDVIGVRSDVIGLRKNLAAMERRLTEKIEASNARLVEMQQSLLRMETRIDAFQDVIANHDHTPTGVAPQ